MLARTLTLLAVTLTLAGLAQAAPAPLRKAAPSEQPEVNLRGWLGGGNPFAGEPSVIACQADYQTVARAWKIENPPKVDFRTHFLAVHVSERGGDVQFDLTSDGDLRIVTRIYYRKCGLEVAGPRFVIRSFRRCDVKTVNGLPLPPKP